MNFVETNYGVIVRRALSMSTLLKNTKKREIINALQNTLVTRIKDMITHNKLIKTSANSPTKTTNSIGNVLGQQRKLNDGLCYEGSCKFYTNFCPVSYSPRVSPSSFWEAMISILSSNHVLQFCIIFISFE